MNRLANYTAAVLGVVFAFRITDNSVSLFSPNSVNFGWRFDKGGEFPGATGKVSVDPTVKREETECLKLEGDFTQGGRYVQAITGINGVDIDELSFWVKGHEQERLTFRIIDAGGQCHQVMIRTKTTPDWQQISFPLRQFFANHHVGESVVRYERWGGAKDGNWHGPAKRFAIIARPLPDQKIVTLWISDPKIFPKTEAATGATGSVPPRGVQGDAPVSPTVQPFAYNEGFEKAARPASWQVTGKVTLEKNGAYRGESCLSFEQDKAHMDAPTSVALDSFPVKPGTWELKAAMKSSLYSPDSSYNGRVVLKTSDATGKVGESFELGVITGDNAWQPFQKTVEIPAGAASAWFEVRMNKTYGKFSVDELSASYIATSRQAVASLTALKFATTARGNMFFPQDKVQFTVTAECVTPLRGSTGEVVCVLKDYWGAELSEPVKIALAEAGKVGKGAKEKLAYKGTLNWSGARLEEGKYYEVHGEMFDPGLADMFRNYSSFAILPEPVTKKYKPFDIPFTSRNWDNRIKECFYLSDRLGIRVCGVWSTWSAQPPYEPTAPGIEHCLTLGMGALLGTPGNVIERHGKNYQDWDATALREGAKILVNKYKDELPIAVYLGNEPHPVDEAQAREMITAYKAMYEGVKAADPKITVIGSSTNPQEIFFKNGFQQYQDVYDFHAYSDAKIVRSHFAKYRDLFAKYGNCAKPIWSTELGLNCQGLSRQAVAIDMIKKFAYFFAEGGVNMSWFDLLYPDPEGKLLGTNAEAFNAFDSRYNLYAPKLDAVCYYNLVNGICIKKFVAEKQYAGDVHAFLFRDKENRCLQILWKDKGHQDALVPLAGVSTVKVLRLDGSSVQLNANGKGVTLNLAEDPLLLLYESKASTLPDQLESPVIALASDPDPVVKGGSVSFTLRLNGPAADDVVVTAPPFWSVRPTGPATWTLTVPEQTTAREGRIVASLKNGTGELYFPVPVTGLMEARLQATPMTGTNTAGVKLIVKNNGREKQTVKTHLSVEQEFPMENGRFNLRAPATAKAYLADAADATLDLDGRQEKEIAVPLAGLDPQTLYRVRAAISDASGRTVKRERFLAGFANVPRVGTSLKLDGVLDEPDWQKSPVLHINEARQFFGLGKPPRVWRGVNDLSGEMRVLWDDQNLYIGVTVTDDVFRNVERDADIWKGDGLQCLIDPFREISTKAGKYDYALAVGTKGPQVVSNYVADNTVPLGEVKGINFVAKPVGNSTGNMTYEIAIPWSHVAPFKPSAGRNLGLTLILNDDDGAGRDCFMGWFSGAHSKEVDMVGDLILGQ